MDVLSEVLNVVKLRGAIFYNGEFSSPWSFCSPPSPMVAPYVAPGAGHVIIYHLLTQAALLCKDSRSNPLRLGLRLPPDTRMRPR
jgi:cupin